MGCYLNSGSSESFQLRTGSRPLFSITRSVVSVPHPGGLCSPVLRAGPWPYLGGDVQGCPLGERISLGANIGRNVQSVKPVYATGTPRKPPLRLLAECSTGQDSPVHLRGRARPRHGLDLASRPIGFPRPGACLCIVEETRLHGDWSLALIWLVAGGCTGRNVPSPHYILSPRNMSQVQGPEELMPKVLCPPLSPPPTSHARSFMTPRGAPRRASAEG